MKQKNYSFTQKENTTQKDDYLIEELNNLSKKAALAFKNKITQDFDLEKYKSFLNIMYHYTSRSAEMLRHCSEVANDQELKEYFTHMVKEERGHYILAQEDLRELGGEISQEKPQTVLDFHDLWFNLDKEIYGYLGAVCVFENIAKYIQVEGREVYEKLGLNKKQRRWLAVHLEADLDHGKEIVEMCLKYGHQNLQAVIKGGKAMCDSWIAVFTSF